MTDNEKALDILQKFDFFGGQRAGRELWNDKPANVQNEDIENFKKDVAFLKDFINRAEMQKKEITRLHNILLSFTNEVSMWSNKKGYDTSEISLIPILDKAKNIKAEAIAEAVKEFAEMVKETAVTNITVGGSTYYCVGLNHLDDLIEEFTEGE